MLNRWRISILIIALALASISGPTLAQPGGAQLVGRAVLPAASLTDGPPAGSALSGGAVINGVKVPFDSQPVGTISAVLRGEYPGTWLALSDARFETPAKSGDYLLRIYTLELDMRRASSGSGDVVPLNWQHLADPDRRIGAPIINSGSPRYLTGADFTPRAFQRVQGAFWVADERGPSLLRFDAFGKLLEPPISIEGGALQGMSILPDGSALIIAQRSGSAQVVFRTYDLTTRTFGQLPGVYTLDRGNSMGGLALVNAREALAIELDGQQGQRARSKRVYKVNLGDGSKTLMADLLNLDDPSGISTSEVFVPPPRAFGLGSPFRFPFSEISAIYPIDEQTVLIANNNRLPFGQGRSTAQADATEFIAVRLVEPLALDPAFQQPLR